MPNIDKWPLLQERYSEPLPIVLKRLLDAGGWELAAEEFDVAESTIGEYMKRAHIKRICLYVIEEPEEMAETLAI